MHRPRRIQTRRRARLRREADGSNTAREESGESTTPQEEDTPPPAERTPTPPPSQDAVPRSTTPSAGQPISIRTRSENQSQPTPDSVLRDLQERYAVVKAQHEVYRLQAEIDAMNAEMAGLGGEASANPRKRAGSSLQREGGNFASRIRHRDAVRFSGKDFDELHRFDKRWRLLIEQEGIAIEEARNEHIRVAAASLDGIASNSWLRWDDRGVCSSWEEFIDFLRDVIQAPELRRANALLAYHRTRLTQGEGVRDLVDKLEQLEKDIPEMEEDERKAWDLIVRLPAAIREELLRLDKPILSRTQVVAEVQKIEELLARKPQQSKPQSGSSGHQQPRRTSPRSGKTPRSEPKWQPREPRNAAGERSQSTPSWACHYCHEKGHFIRDCPKKAAQERKSFPGGPKNG
jgi:hypothetical protein